MSYVLSVGVCLKSLMGYQTLHLSVQNATANKDYESFCDAFIALLTIRIKALRVIFEASKVSVYPF
jgi:hypothetical protein